MTDIAAAQENSHEKTINYHPRYGAGADDGFFSGAAFAGHGRGNDGKDHGDSYTSALRVDDSGLTANLGGGVSIHIGTQDRDAIKSYMRKSYAKKCPPGLAKKHNGCLPPGIAKKYTVGRDLPAGISYEPLPGSLRELLHQAPRGYQYVQVDKDVLLINEATKKVVDAVTLLSAVGN